MTRLAILLWSCLFLSATPYMPPPQEPEIRWIRTDTKAELGSRLSAANDIIFYSVRLDSTNFPKGIQGLVTEGGAFSRDKKIQEFSITFMPLSGDFNSFRNKGNFLNTDALKFLQNLRAGSFVIAGIKLSGPSGSGSTLKRSYRFNIL